MYSGVRQIAVHTVDLGQIPAAADRTYIHFQFLMATVVAVSQRQIDTLVEAHIHGSVDQCLDGFGIVINGIFYILDLTAVAQIPETVLQILFLDRRNILCHMAMEAVADIFSVGYTLDNTVFFTELLDLKTAQILRWGSVDGIQIAVLFLVLGDLLVDMLQNFYRKCTVFHQ